MTRPTNDQLNRLALLLQTAALAATEANLALALNLLAIATTALTTIPTTTPNSHIKTTPHLTTPNPPDSHPETANRAHSPRSGVELTEQRI